MNENSRTCVSVWSPGQGGVGLGEWGMDAQTGAAGYNFTIKIEVQLLGPGVGNGAISATIKICKKRSILCTFKSIKGYLGRIVNLVQTFSFFY